MHKILILARHELYLSIALIIKVIQKFSQNDFVGAYVWNAIGAHIPVFLSMYESSKESCS